ncbi:NAD(P)/FAD-dependent oxidoreductase [Ruania alkalisoli]|uniref:NAD(P)/FAD-dependent oxidoreductase n=1 Tax=Ruania alkalisoli TaxID=2779775 RepID=A0A7M1SWX6_9MICO|nr:FAD-dependent oxidoreductase [Ruania alkalisoli]QOR72001.1 NAD(P)/FAD-dependent oxidoreductase [Ruania alkalisoli]
MTAPTRIVVVGHGMVGARFVDDLLARAEPGTLEIEVLGGEEYEPYNRVLLSDVVAGRTDLNSLTLPVTASEHVTVTRGAVATAIDRAGQCVHTPLGHYYYDHLVLATGARARIPAVEGLDCGLPAGVHALRTLDDAREIIAATTNARHATVVGAGVLGLEAACGLVRRGLDVTVLHTGHGPMDRQLDQGASAVVTAELERLGAQVRTQARTTAVRTRGGRLTGVVATVGETEHVLATDLLVLACGTQPEARLAQEAGLPVGRGIRVGGDLASPADSRVHAIGDCAEPTEGATGLIAQGWDQARRLADRLAGVVAARANRATRVDRASPLLESRRPSMALRLALAAGTRPIASHEVDADSSSGAADLADPAAGLAGTDVVRLKAAGLDVVTMGRTATGGWARTVTLSDPSAGRHLTATVSDGLIVAATCVGAPDVGADLVAAYTRRLPVPSDPAHLLLRPLTQTPAPAADPSRMPAGTTVCTCNGVTKADITDSWERGARSTGEIARATRATTGCGGCTDAVCGLAQWLSQTERPAASHAGGVGGEETVTEAQRGQHTCEIAAS